MLVCYFCVLQAYGYDGLGILAVRNVPHMAENRARCLPMAYRFGNLPAEVKAKYEHAASFYSFGWSHGKEKLEGKADFAKGSYYANPVHDRPVVDEEIIKKYPAFAHPNIWPTEEDCAGFEKAFKTCAGMMVDVGKLLAKHCDAYVRTQLASFGAGDKPSPVPMHRIIRDCRCHKARLLMYFPASAGDSDADVSSWW
jgi:hypothetical protein